jgi:nicotinate dehydrogenase subunit A
MTQRFRLTVNGTEREVETDPDTTLLLVLRNELGLLGARFGCGVGLCGACFVRMDGVVVAACDTPIWSADGRTVVTVEGLADGDALHPVQQAFLDAQAAQCGYCVSGILVSAAALLERDPYPDEPAVVAALERNLCRCGVQRRMVAAIVEAGHRMKAPSADEPRRRR